MTAILPLLYDSITKESPPLKIESAFEPAGDQPAAIAELVKGLEKGEKDQVLLGVTGSGKTFTMAHVIETLQRPALILAPNKILAAQLYGEMKDFFPHNAVEYFVSYYDYYQPEAYVARTDTYIEKTASINEQIDRMRHSATRSLLERKDVIVVASVSCIYGIGSPEFYSSMVLRAKVGGVRVVGVGVGVAVVAVVVVAAFASASFLRLLVVVVRGQAGAHQQGLGANEREQIVDLALYRDRRGGSSSSSSRRR